MDDFETAVIQHYSFLKRSAHALAREHSLAEDLVQDVVLAALAKRHLFIPGSNLKAWLYTILRNRYFTIKRKHRETEDPEGLLEANLSVQPSQHDRLEYLEAQEIVSDLPEAYRNAIVLASEGFSYQEMAATLDIAEGTVKSRVSRGRKLLLQVANGEVVIPRQKREGKRTYSVPQIKLAPSPIQTMPSTGAFIPAEKFRLIGRDLRQQTVQIYRLAK